MLSLNDNGEDDEEEDEDGVEFWITDKRVAWDTEGFMAIIFFLSLVFQ